MDNKLHNTSKFTWLPEILKLVYILFVCCVYNFLFRYALKSLDKKRIKLKQGEALALNERIMLSLVIFLLCSVYLN